MLRWRPDGDYVGDVPNTRRILPYLMPGRNESAFYWEHRIDTRKTTQCLERFRERTGLRATMLHLLIWASAQAMHIRPRMNRFAAGGRLYQRREIQISFSAKKGKTDHHPLIAIKRRIDPAWSFEEMVRHVEDGIREGRSDGKTSTDRELELLFKLPGFAVDLVASAMKQLDRFGLLPQALTRHDPFFSSVFITNMGSIDMDAGWHHLYEYGTVSMFVVAGRIKDEPVVLPDGSIEARPLMTIRYTFDERIEDGLYCIRSLELFRQLVEDPEKAMGIDLQPEPALKEARAV
jgi:hypothetical protein